MKITNIMYNNTHSEAFAFRDENGKITGYGIASGVPDKCDHDDNGDSVYFSASGKVIKWHTYKQWRHLDSRQRGDLIMRHHYDIDDPITSCMPSCSKCKKTLDIDFNAMI